MDDFLHNLRQGQKKAQNRGRRPYDKSRAKGRNYPAKEASPTPGNIRGDQTEQFAKIRESLESIADNQHLQIALEERKAVAQEKQAQALEGLSGALTQLIDAMTAMVTSAAGDGHLVAGHQEVLKPYALPPNIDELEALTRDEIKSIISELRDTGLSYEKIANQLNDRKVRTITGRGIWRGQTVYRLFLE